MTRSLHSHVRVVSACIPAILLGVACHSSGGNVGACTGSACNNANSGTWATLGTPTAAPSAQPGYLAIGPAGLQLAVGATAQLWAKLYDSSGAAQPAPSMTWASSSTTVLSVSTSGLVTAAGLGYAEVSGTDGSHGTWILPISVTQSPPTGAAGIQFAPPNPSLAVGQTVQLSYTLTDATGATITPTPVLTFSSSSSGVASISSAGLVTASAAGAASIVAVAQGGTTPLSGQAYVVVGPASASGNGGSTGSGDDAGSSSGGGGGSGGTCASPVVVACVPQFPPQAFSTPNLTDKAPLLAYVCRECVDGQGHSTGPMTCDLETPDSVTGQGDVVSLVSGYLASGASPGVELMRELSGGVDCTAAGPLVVEVSPNLGGGWQATCKNGDTGSFSVPPWPSAVSHSPENWQAYGAGTGVYGFWAQAGETSCFNGQAGAGGAPAFTCTGSPDFDRGGATFTGWGSGGGGSSPPAGACTSSQACVGGIEMSDCAVSRHAGSWEVLGPDTLGIGAGDCSVTRGGSATCGVGTDASADAAADANLSCTNEWTCEADWEQGDAGSCACSLANYGGAECAPAWDAAACPGMSCCASYTGDINCSCVDQAYLDQFGYASCAEYQQSSVGTQCPPLFSFDAGS